MKILKFSVMVSIAILSFVAFLAPYWAFSEKNPQAECINGQNDIAIGNEQKGDAYKFNKDTCQQLSK